MGRLYCRTHFSKTLDKSEIIDYNRRRKKARPQTVMPNLDYFLDSPNLVGGGYLTFFVSAIKKITIKNIVLNMYFPIATTSFPMQQENKMA